MKTILLLTVIALSLSCNAQWAQHRSKYQGTPKDEAIEVLPSVGILFAGFTANEAFIHSDKFATLTLKEKRQQTFTIYSTTIITMVVTHYVIKDIRRGKVIKKIKRKLWIK